MRRGGQKQPTVIAEPLEEQEFLAILTDCALPADVSRVFDDYMTIGRVGACEAQLIVHKALLRR